MLESRNHIKTRMLRNAARVWGYSEMNAENNFDPLVSMLLSACSIELEKISSDIHASRARVLERLVQLLSPDALTGPFPAHSIATATPSERTFTIQEDDQYYVSKKVISNHETGETTNKDIFFSPTAAFSLRKCCIRFMAVGSTLYELKSALGKDPAIHSDGDKELPACSLWIAIDEPATPLAGTMFYFDCRNEANRQLFYHHLPMATWYWDDRAITHISGYGEHEISGEHLDINSIIGKEDDTTGKIKKHINAFYKPYFITLTDKHDVSGNGDNSMLSSMISDVFAGKGAKELGKHQLRWICIDFPQAINNRILQDVICTANCFPVFNRKLHDITYRMHELGNIIPLHTDDVFLDLQGVTDEEGTPLNAPQLRGNTEGESIMMMRNGGVGRFDERDAASVVNYIIQLLRSESAAFSILGNDFISNEIRQIQQVINKLEQRLYSTPSMLEQVPYLVVRNPEKQPLKNIYIKYWSTAGTDANNIKASTNLMMYRGSGLITNKVTLLSATVGGKNRLDTTESVLAYKSALLSKERIITTEDIKAFCHYQLGKRANSVEVKNGVDIGPDQKKGFVKTVDVVVNINNEYYEEMEEKGELSFWTDNLKLHLENNSVAFLPYRIFIQKAS